MAAEFSDSFLVGAVGLEATSHFQSDEFQDVRAVVRELNRQATSRLRVLSLTRSRDPPQIPEIVVTTPEGAFVEPGQDMGRCTRIIDKANQLVINVHFGFITPTRFGIKYFSRTGEHQVHNLDVPPNKNMAARFPPFIRSNKVKPQAIIDALDEMPLEDQWATYEQMKSAGVGMKVRSRRKRVSCPWCGGVGSVHAGDVPKTIKTCNLCP